MTNRPYQFPTMALTCLLFAGQIALATGQTAKRDNSAVNSRDQSAAELTAQDQSATEQATNTTRLIRHQLTKDSTLSTYAKNVKIIVIGDRITLKGPVKSDTEKLSIVRTANNVAPQYKIDNQIEIAK